MQRAHHVHTVVHMLHARPSVFGRHQGPNDPVLAAQDTPASQLLRGPALELTGWQASLCLRQPARMQPRPQNLPVKFKHIFLPCVR